VTTWPRAQSGNLLSTLQNAVVLRHFRQMKGKKRGKKQTTLHTCGKKQTTLHTSPLSCFKIRVQIRDYKNCMRAIRPRSAEIWMLSLKRSIFAASSDFGIWGGKAFPPCLLLRLGVPSRGVSGVETLSTLMVPEFFSSASNAEATAKHVRVHLSMARPICGRWILEALASSPTYLDAITVSLVDV